MAYYCYVKFVLVVIRLVSLLMLVSVVGGGFGCWWCYAGQIQRCCKILGEEYYHSNNEVVSKKCLNNITSF